MTRLFRILIAVVALTTGLTASAETKKTDDTAHFGARVQLDFNSSTTESDIVHWGPGFSVGVAYYAPFGRITYFNTGLLFSYDTFKFGGWTGSKYSPRYMDGHMTTIGLRLPFDLGFKLIQNKNITLSLYTGPHIYGDFQCHAKYKNIRATWVEDVDKNYTISGLEIGWAVGAAVDFKQRWHLHFEYMLGLSNMAMTDDIRLNQHSDFKREELSLGIGYNF